MNKVQNLAIMASAGTGKTYTLGMRYITLLLLGVEPEEIVAMTFTNKAAGEIFDKIIQILLELLNDPKKLEDAIKSDLIPKGTTSADLTKILRKIFSKPGKLRISTFDSFFFDIVRTFPLECGISGEISLADEDDENKRTEYLLQLIRDSKKEQRDAILEILKKISYNQEKISVLNEASAMIEEYYPRYLKCPEREIWVHDSFLTPGISGEDILTAEKLKNIERDLSYESLKYKGSRLAQLIEAFGRLALRAVDFTNQPVNLKSAVLDQLCAILSGNMNTFGLDFLYYKQLFHVEGMLLRSCKEIFAHFAAVEDRFMQEAVSSLYDLLDRFDRIYAVFARYAGHLTFNDIPYLLKNDSACNPLANRLVMEERLDAQYNHYLLDEFQDTSDEQWDIMKNLVNEIFQPEQDRFRSFFYVGDIKQSIYQWRNGNPKLFSHIYRQYSDPGYNDAQLQLKTLSKSFRSSEPVIDTVNRVFGHPERILSANASEAVRQMEFETHTSSESAKAQPGCAMLIEVPEAKSKTGLSSKSIFDLIVSLNPFSEKHNCTVGILTRKNDAASELAEDFRNFLSMSGEKAEFDVSLDGFIMVNECPAYSIYQNLLKLAEHPDDPMARGYLSMIAVSGNKHIMEFPLLDPIGEKIISNDAWFDQIGSFIRRSIASGGFTPFLQRYLNIFKSYFSPADSVRMDILLDTAMDFDAGGNKNIADFLLLLDKLKNRSSSVRKTVQFMTIHKAKGLDFDIVILPELLQKKSFDEPSLGGALLTLKDDSFQPIGISFLPKSNLLSAFPKLQEASQEKKSSMVYEACCLLYVAMTRARNALYMLVPEQQGQSDVYSYVNLLKETLIDPDFKPIESEIGKVLYSTGDPEWIEKKVNKVKTSSLLIQKARETFSQLAEKGLEENAEVILPKRVMTRKPSDHQGRPVMRAAKTPYDGTELGTHIHEMMSRIGYLDECDTEQLLSEYVADSGISGPIADDLASIFRKTAASPDAAAILSRPAGSAELWREKKFMIRKDGKLISCVFDRVDVIRDPSGNVCKVRILDYKSDNSDDPEYFRTNYTDQLAIYADVLQSLFGIVPEKNIFMLRSAKNLLLD